jgi:ABC-2 type transport system permease protein
MDSMSTSKLVKSGAAFDFQDFAIRPLDEVSVALAIGTVFVALCVRQFRKADFSRARILKRGGHRQVVPRLACGA